MQKMVLANFIRDEKEHENELRLSVVDQIKVYINPEMYLKELEARGEKSPSGKYNSEFDQHSISARLTGKPKLSPEMEKAVKKSWEGRTVRTAKDRKTTVSEPTTVENNGTNVNSQPIRRVVMDQNMNIVHEEVLEQELDEDVVG